MTERIETKVGLIYESTLLSGIGDVEHGFGTRGVPLKDYLCAMDYEVDFIAETDQMHGCEVFELTGDEDASVIEADAFITSKPRVMCFVRSADCVPILIADKNAKAVGAIHAGWRGTSCDIAGKTVSEISRTFQVSADSLVACIGPCICPNCFKVGPEVMAAFDKLQILGWKADDSHVDLARANFELLKRAGLSADNIEVIEECTFCNEEFASFRRDKSESERQFSFIFIRG